MSDASIVAPESPLRSRLTGRRAVLGTAAWGVPAVVVASAAPAFARSVNLVPPMACSTVAGIKSLKWSVSPADGLAGWDAAYTGWHPMPSGVSEADKQYYAHGAYVSAGTDAFTSGADNGQPNVASVVTVDYLYEISGDADVTVSTDVTVGYGSGTPNVERQDVVIQLIDGAQISTVAQVTTRHQLGDGTPQPWGSVAGIGTSDAEMVARGYSLQDPYNQGTKTYASDRVSITGGANRTVIVRATFTLHAIPVVRLDADGKLQDGYWVNDDITISRPQLIVNC